MITLAKTTGALLIAGFTLSACAEGALTTSPNANRNQGALIGAAAGAALGQLAGGDTESTAIGAALGAGAGALIGYNLDQQEAELRRDLAGSGATIENTGDRLIVNLPNDVTFATGSSTVQPGFRSQLVQLSQSLNTYAQSRVQITGHTDSVGAADFNQGLSEARALSVAQVLIGQGVPSSRLNITGAGETQPIASNDTEAGRAQNRRVEVVIIPTQQ